jgi:dTDP-glucose 4,6-dehydratase
VYGDVAVGVSTEGDALRPRSPYSASKAGAEMLVSAYRASYGMPVIATRGSNTYGPYQFPEKIIPLFITNAIDDRRLPIYGDGGAVRDYLHVTDHVRAIDLALRSGTPGEDYNIGYGGATNGLEVADLVLEALHKPASLKQMVRDRRGHDRRYAVDTAKIRALGWEPRIPLGSGLAQTVRWYQDNQAWWRPLKSDAFWEFYERNYAPAEAGPPERP